MECPQIICWRFLGELVLLLVLCCSAQAADEQCVVVLRSGGVLHGAVTVNGERYVVVGPNRAIDVPAMQVLLVAPTMEAAYLEQRKKLPNDNADAHLRLAEWCLRYDLLQPAAEEIAEARRTEPRDPRVALLERRLAVATHPKKSSSTHAPRLVHDDNKSNTELQYLKNIADELPAGAVERFARKVQPLLVNSCTASGCHRPGGEQKFQLDRAVLHGLTNRRITLRNLVATLALVDRASPRRSELLTVARRTHGGMDHPVFGSRREAQFKQLADWVGMLTETDFQPASFEPPVADVRPIQPPAGAPLPSIASRLKERLVVEADYGEEVKPLRPKAEVKFGLDLRPWQPKDEFDPEIFNRVNRSEESPSATALGPSSTY